MLSDRLLPQPNPAVVFRALPDGAVLLSTETEVYFGLNRVGARIWELLPPSTASLDELCACLEAEFPDAPDGAIRDDVTELLQALAADRLVLPLVEHRAPRPAATAAAAL